MASITHIAILTSFILVAFGSADGISNKPGSKSYFHHIVDVNNKLQRYHNETNKALAVENVSNLFGHLTYKLQYHPNKNYVKQQIISVLSDITKTSVVANSTRCVSNLGQLLEHIVERTSWAIQFFDATGKPGPSITKGWFTLVGNYDQCLAATANKAQVKYPFSGAYFDMTFNILGIPGQIGLCLPDTCSGYDVKNIVQSFLDSENVTAIIVSGVEKRPNETKATSATVVSTIIIAMLTVFAVMGTLYDIVWVQQMFNQKETNTDCQESKESQSDYIEEKSSKYKSVNNSANCETTKLINKERPPSVVVKAILAFSFYSNGKKLLDTKQAPGSLSSIHGIRFLSMSWVVLGHFYLFVAQGYGINITTEYPKLMKRVSFAAIANALVSVDTFFTLSGLLTAYIAIKELKRLRLRINWGLFYFHRFWRLSPPYMLALLFVLGFQQYLGKGALWANTQPSDKLNCENNWWTNLLYVNNLVNVDGMCFGHSWYLANDMQFFVISPIMLIPFYFHWLAGIGSCVVLLLITTITTGVLAYDHDWIVGLIGNITISEKLNWFHHYYVVPWCRIGPYIVGIMAGYILSVKGTSFRMPKWLAAAGWFVATVSALAVLYGTTGDISGEHPSSRFGKALYNSVGRSVWGACVSWVIIACSAGYGGPINALLSWSPFVTLGRLTYMTYLIHLSLLNVFGSNMGFPWFVNDSTAPIMYIGFLFFVNMVSFVFVLLLESPMIGLEKVLIPQKKSR